MQQSFRKKETITDKETNHRSRPKSSNKTVHVSQLTEMSVQNNSLQQNKRNISPCQLKCSKRVSLKSRARGYKTCILHWNHHRGYP
jgi:hypothetical protein